MVDYLAKAIKKLRRKSLFKTKTIASRSTGHRDEYDTVRFGDWKKEY